MADEAIRELRDHFAEDEAGWADIRKARQADIKALGPSSTWDDKDRKAREEAGRPCLAFDELGQYVNQLVNDARETKRAIEVSPGPRGDSPDQEQREASEAEARVIAGWVRQVEHRSNAQLAYTQMFQDAVSGSYGFLRISSRYLQRKVNTPTARSFEQELVIVPVPNPEIITPGHFNLPDMSDCSRFWVTDSYEHEEFKRAFPDADIQDFTGYNLGDAGPNWVDGKKVWVRELWQLLERPRKLCLLPHPADPQGEPVAFWVDEIPDADREKALKTAIRERTVQVPYVCQKITNGIEILDKKEDWPGIYLPIVGCLGKTLWRDGEREILSLIRLALGPQQLYNYYRTSEAEIVGMTPKVPWFYYEGALDQKNEDALAASNQVPAGAVKVKPTSEGWNAAANGPLPFPSRLSYEPPIQAMEMGAESTRRSIQAATGTGFLPTQAQRQNEKSGVALREINSSAQKGAYHLVDNFKFALRRTGEVLVDLFPHFNETARDIYVRAPDDKPILVRINDPKAPAPKEFGGKPIEVSDGEFDVTVSDGPSYDTEREKAWDFANTMLTARSEVFTLIGPDVIRLANLGPLGDKMAEYLEAMQPPQIQQLRSGQQPMPPQAQQAIAQLQQAQQVIQQLQKIIETDEVKEGKKTERELALKELDGQIRLALTELQGKQKLQQKAADVAADIDTREDEQAHDMSMAAADASQSEQQQRQAAQAAALTASTAHLNGKPPTSSPSGKR